MPLALKKVKNTELRVQWSGNWEAFYDGTNSGFPGIHVPFDLCGLLASIKGMWVQVDTDDYDATLRASVRQLFESVIDTEGPGNSRWVLFGNAFGTTSNHIRWVGLAADSLAFRIGTQALTPAGDIDPTAAPFPYEDPYAFGPAITGQASYWVCFTF